MIRTVIIENGTVTNIVMHDPDGGWTPPEGAVLVASDEAGPGDTWNGHTFTPLPRSTEQVTVDVKVRLAAIDANSTRPLRAILAAQAAGRVPDPADMDRLVTLEAEADTLRGQLAR